MSAFKTRQQIADEYGIDRSTLYRRLKRKGVILPRTMLNLHQVHLIYQALGKPQHIQVANAEMQQDDGLSDGNATN